MDRDVLIRLDPLHDTPVVHLQIACDLVGGASKTVGNQERSRGTSYTRPDAPSAYAIATEGCEFLDGPGRIGRAAVEGL